MEFGIRLTVEEYKLLLNFITEKGLVRFYENNNFYINKIID